MGKYIITKIENGEFQFNLLDSDGQTILYSTRYSVKYSCLNGVESVQSNSQISSRYEKQNVNGKYYFNLKGSNGRIIATSKMYESELERNFGIDTVRKNGASSIIEILS